MCCEYDLCSNLKEFNKIVRFNVFFPLKVQEREIKPSTSFNLI